MAKYCILRSQISVTYIKQKLMIIMYNQGQKLLDHLLFKYCFNCKMELLFQTHITKMEIHLTTICLCVVFNSEACMHMVWINIENEEWENSLMCLSGSTVLALIVDIHNEGWIVGSISFSICKDQT